MASALYRPCRSAFVLPIGAPLPVAPPLASRCGARTRSGRPCQSPPVHGKRWCRLSRTYAALTEALDRHRGKGQQRITVEHVNVHAGGQAIVGAVTPRDGSSRRSEEQTRATREITNEPTALRLISGSDDEDFTRILVTQVDTSLWVGRSPRPMRGQQQRPFRPPAGRGDRDHPISSPLQEREPQCARRAEKHPAQQLRPDGG